MKQLLENWRKYITEQKTSNIFDLLSDTERLQLGQPYSNKSKFNYSTKEEWAHIRGVLVQRSLASNSKLDPEYVAYTPGETLHLMSKPTISNWHKEISGFKLPEETSVVVFVPCAKSKPWVCGQEKKRQLSKSYRAYNRLRGERGETPSFYFVTISEPLGIVPEDRWHDFPQYDNPGLFKDSPSRVDRVFTRDWPKIFGMSKVITPYDKNAYQESIEILSSVIANFMKTNKDKEFISFVAERGGTTSTHTDMLNKASQKAKIEIERSPKTLRPRGEPEEPIRTALTKRGMIE